MKIYNHLYSLKLKTFLLLLIILFSCTQSIKRKTINKKIKSRFTIKNKHKKGIKTYISDKYNQVKIR